MFYHNTIRRYTLLLLDKFKNIELQYKNSNEEIITKNIPIHYKVQEKEFLLDKSTEQIITGNTNVIPRAVLELNSLSPNTDRQSSKYLKINKILSQIGDNGNYKNFQWNCISYDFTYTLTIFCRGMSEVCQIIEEIAPKFNPIMYLDVYDAEDESSPTRVPLQLTSIEFSPNGLDETSINAFNVSFSLTLSGYLFQPINAYSTIKEFYINLYDNNSVKEQMKFNVVDTYPQLQPTITHYDYSDIKLDVISLNKDNNNITVIYDSNIQPEINFECENAEILEINNNTCVVNKNRDFTITAILTYGSMIQKITKEY